MELSVPPAGRLVGEADHRPDFAAFYTAVWPDLAGYAASLLGDAGADAAQEALTRVFVRWALVREPRAYAFRVVTKLARDSWAAARRTGDAPSTDRPHADPDRDLLDAVRRLRQPYRDVLLLHYWADLPVADVARVLRRPAGTVKRRLSEARAELLRRWEESA